MKLLHVITNFAQVGGAEVAMVSVVNGLPEHAHSIVSLRQCSAANQKLLKRADTAVHALEATSAAGLLTALPSFARIRKQSGAEVIISWMYHANTVACLDQNLCRHTVPIVWTVHHALDYLKEERLSTRAAIVANKWMSGQPQRIVYVSKNTRCQHERYGFAAKKATVIEHGITVPEVQQAPPLATPDGAITIGVMARFHPAKGYPTLFDALAQIFDRYPNTRARLAGTGIEPQNPGLARLIKHARIDSEKLELLGPIRDKTTFFEGVDLFVVASLTEAGPLALIEAMAHGIPCVSTDVGDAVAMLGATGAAVPAGDPQALAHAIERLLHHPDRALLGQQAAAHVRSHYSSSRMLQRYKQEMARLVGIQTM